MGKIGIEKIRKVNTNDLDAFMSLYKLSYKGLEEYAYTKNRDIKHYFKWLVRRDEEGFFVAEIGEPIGFIACDTNWISFLMTEKLEKFMNSLYTNGGGRELVKSY